MRKGGADWNKKDELRGFDEMKKYQKYLWVMLVMPLILMANAQAHTPDGTVVIDETQMMLLLGGSFGGGTVIVGDDSYSFKANGLKLGGVGVHKVHLTGSVYDLDDIKDFAGVYFAAEAGATVVKGIGGFWLKNKRGVTLHLKVSAKGLALALGLEGLKITMK